MKNLIVDPWCSVPFRSDLSAPPPGVGGLLMTDTTTTPRAPRPLCLPAPRSGCPLVWCCVPVCEPASHFSSWFARGPDGGNAAFELPFGRHRSILGLIVLGSSAVHNPVTLVSCPRIGRIIQQNSKISLSQGGWCYGPCQLSKSIGPTLRVPVVKSMLRFTDPFLNTT